MSTEDPLIDAVRFSCPECGKRLKVPRKFAGRSAPCPKCGHSCRIPEEAPAADEAPRGTPAADPVPPPNSSAVPRRFGPPPPERPADLLDERVFTPILCPHCGGLLMMLAGMGMESDCQQCGRPFVAGVIDTESARRGYVRFTGGINSPDGSYLVSRFTGDDDHYRRIYLAAALSRQAVREFMKGKKQIAYGQLVLALGQHSGFWPKGIGCGAPEQSAIRFGEPIAYPGTPLNLAGADLREGIFYNTGWGFCGANLRGALLDDANWLEVLGRLNQADFTQASLRNVVVFQAHCDGALFRGADCAGATLGLCTEHRANSPYDSGLPADFSEANFEGAKLNFTMLAMAGLFRGAHLRKCTITTSDTCEAGAKFPLDFTGADLTEASLAGNITATFEGARMPGCKVPERLLPALSAKQQGEVEVVKSKNCFLATAAWGTESAPDVVRLRRFREEVLRRRPLGRGFISLYEALSPPLARGLARSELLRAATRRWVVGPARRLADCFLSDPAPPAD